MNITQALIGDTVKTTWVDSGVTPSTITAELFTGSETSIVAAGAMVSSNNGHFFRLMTLPDTPGFYVSETLAIIDGFPYKRRRKIHAILGEVD